jgi:excisionase family DNA binding protein
MTTTMHALNANRTPQVDEALEKISALLSREDHALSLRDEAGDQVVLPAEVIEAFSQVIAALRARKPTVFYPQQAMVTTEQAATFLHVSRPYLIKLLDEGKIPYSMTGSHRRIQFQDLAAFKVEWDRKRDAAFRELIRISEEAGLYDMEQTMDIDFRSK